MRNVLILFCFSFCIQLFPGCKINQVRELTNLASRIQKKYAPDSRIALFDVKINRNGRLAVEGETNIAGAFNELDSMLQKDFPKVDNIVKLLPDQAPDSYPMGLISISVANLRRLPDHASELVTQAILGTPVKILKREADWFLMQTPDSYLGWATVGGIGLYTEKGLSNYNQSERIIFTNLTGTCYSLPDKNSRPVCDLVAGSILETTGSKMGFREVQSPFGGRGYIPQEQCMLLSEWRELFPPGPEAIVETALNFLGLPYLWGGTSSKGVDCSGFTKTVFFMNGIILQRDASQQALYGELIDTKDNFNKLEPGDLLFFGTHETDSTTEKVTHVGIYIGDGEMIHSSGIVKINSLIPGKNPYSSHLTESFIRARRILTSVGQPGIESVFSTELYFTSIDTAMTK